MAQDENIPAGGGRGLSQNLQGSAWMFGTVLSLSLMALAARELASSYNTFQILFARNAVGFLIILAIVLQQDRSLIRTRRVGMHTLRNSFHIAAVACWFFGIGHLPLAEVFVLELTLPIWVLLLATPFLGERMSPPRLIGVGLGFLGILIVLRPGIAIIDPVALVVLAGAVGFGAANVATKALTRTDAPLTIVFWMFLIQLVMSTPPALPGLAMPQPIEWIWVIAVGATGISAHYCNAKGLSLADSGLIMPMHYLRVPLIALLGWLVYDESVDIWLGLGAVVIFAGAMATLRDGRR